MKVTVEFNEDDAQEVVELGQELLAIVRRLENLEKRLEAMLDAR